MRALHRLFGIGLISIALGWRVGAVTTTNATCTTAQWTFNQENQSPCFVAAALLGSCNGGNWIVYAISSTQVYQGADVGGSNGCLCSTVPYSLISACATCQGAEVGTWSEWSNHCNLDDIHISSFPLTIPSSVAVPAWAYLNVTIGGTWDSNAAINDHGPESSAVATASSTSSAVTSLTSSIFPTSSRTSSASKSSSNVGPIVGGVVGGIGGLALLGLIGFLLYRRKKNTQQSGPIVPSAAGENQTLMGFKGGSPESVPSYPGRTSAMIMTTQAQNMKLYNPDDPSTYPAMQPPSQPPSGYTNPGGYASAHPAPLTPLTPPAVPEI